MKKLLVSMVGQAVLGLAVVASGACQKTPVIANRLAFDVSGRVTPPEVGFLNLGGRSSNGHNLTINSRYLEMDGKPWLPVMGEFHFSRYPDQGWEDEIVKMKAGGVQVISTYIFWIHHQELERAFDWSGQRDLRRFVELCAKHQMYVYLRIGPWVHGEARNGGLPDWLLAKATKLRQNDPVYLQYTGLFFDEIGKQVQGLLWKDGGPVIGVQVENEYGETGPGAGAEHLQKLKDFAVHAGLTVPIYSATEWPLGHPMPQHEMIPMGGGYPDGFWADSLTNQPPKAVYLFRFNRSSGDMGAMTQDGTTDGAPDPLHYPYGKAEAGAGMQVAYHRRPLIKPEDITSLTLTGIGSGVNFYGYFMFQGGANPGGNVTSLQESQKTGYLNDLPQVSYDFQAPLGQYGQAKKSFYELKILNLFLNEFGDYLAPMQAAGPDVEPKDAADTQVPRAAIRARDGSGFIFVNNFIRQYPMPERKEFQVQVHLPAGDLSVPLNPVTVPADSYFIWPFNLDIGGPKLTYSTAQLITKVSSGNGFTYFFFAVPGIAPEFLFEGQSTSSVQAIGTKIVREQHGILVSDINPDKNQILVVHGRAKKEIRIVVLTEPEAESLWKVALRGTEYVLLSKAMVLPLNGHQLQLRSTEPAKLGFALFNPSGSHLDFDPTEFRLRAPKSEGNWVEYSADVVAQKLVFRWTKVKAAGPAPAVQFGKVRNPPIVEIPDDNAFDNAAAWSVQFPKQNLKHLNEVYLQIKYVGDVGRAFIADRLIDDNFYNGTSWTIGLKRFVPKVFGERMDIKVLPLRRDAPIYLDEAAWKKVPATGQIADIESIKAVPEYQETFTLRTPR